MMKRDNDNQNPWAGLSSYEDPAKSELKLKFCGRDNETKEVARLIDDNFFVTLYGKSGIGKTSLLNAGVFPALRREQYTPLCLRLGMTDKTSSFQYVITQAIECAIDEVGGSVHVINVLDEQTEQDATDYLWRWFARRRFVTANGQITFPVLVFDQFEEVFRHKESRQKTRVLLEQLNYLIDESHAIGDCVVDGEEYNYDFNFRFVLSIREDDLYRLEDAIDNCVLSALKRCRYRLRSLSERGAQDAILIPGEGLFLKDQQNDIVEKIIKKSRNEDGSISTYIVSLLCSRIFVNYQQKKNANKPEASHITLALVDAFLEDKPFERFYKEATSSLSKGEKTYIEENLVDRFGRRNSVPENVFLDNVKHGSKLMKGDTRILQRIGTSAERESYHIELIHDQLAIAIKSLIRTKSNRWKSILLRVSILALVIIVSLLLGFCARTTTKKYNQQLSTLRLDAHDFSTDDSLWIDQSCLHRNTLVEKLTIIDKTKYTIDECPYLHTLNLRRVGHDTLSLNLKNCVQLQRLLLPEKLSWLSLSVDNCPILELNITPGLGYVEIEPMVELLKINMGSDVTRYREIDDVIWDVQDRRVVYYPKAQADGIKGGIFRCSFPPEIKNDKLSYGDVTLTNTDYVEVIDGSSWSYSTSRISSPSQLLSTVNRRYNWMTDCFILPESLDILPVGLFKGRIHLDSVVMPKVLNVISSDAFIDCRKLRNITLPATLTTIGDRAFMNCKSLRHIVIPARVNSIGAKAFEGCTSLESVEFLGEEVWLGNRAFANCPSLTSVKLPRYPKFDATTQLNSPFYKSSNFEGAEQFYVRQNDEILRRDDYELAVDKASRYVIRLHDDASEIFLPTGFPPDKYFFEPDASELNHIHVPWPQPDCFVRGYKYKLSFELTKEDRQHITLHVPYGCKRYYELNDQLKGYRAIVEDSPLQYTKYWVEGIVLSSVASYERWAVTICILLTLLFVAIFIVQRQWWQKIGLEKSPSWPMAALYALLFTLTVIIIHTIFSWFFILYCGLSYAFSPAPAGVVSLLLSVGLFLAPQYIGFLNKKAEETGRKEHKVNNMRLLAERGKCFVKRVGRWIGKFWKAFAAVLLVAFLAAFLLSRSQHSSTAMALVEGNYPKALQLYADSLIEADSVTMMSILQMYHILAMNGDSSQLKFIGSEHFDDCNLDYLYQGHVFKGICFHRGDTAFIFNGHQAFSWAKKNDPFKRGNACAVYPDELTVRYYDELSDLTAIIFLNNNSEIVCVAGKYPSVRSDQQLIVSKKKDGQDIISDYKGRSIPFMQWKSCHSSGYQSVYHMEDGHSIYDLAYFNTENGPVCLNLPEGNSVGMMDGRYFIWEVEKNRERYAYDILLPRKAPAKMDKDGYFENAVGQIVKFDKDKDRFGVKVTGTLVETSDGRKFNLPNRYANAAGSTTTSTISGRYFWRSDITYDEVAIFDLNQGGRQVAELKGKSLRSLSSDRSVIYTDQGDSVQFYYLTPEVAIPTFRLLKIEDFDLSIVELFHSLGNYLFFNENCDGKRDVRVYSTKIPYAQQVVLEKGVFACGDSLMIANPEASTIDFYRYENLSELLERSEVLDRKQKVKLKKLIKNNY